MEEQDKKQAISPLPNRNVGERDVAHHLVRNFETDIEAQNAFLALFQAALEKLGIEFKGGVDQTAFALLTILKKICRQMVMLEPSIAGCLSEEEIKILFNQSLDQIPIEIPREENLADDNILGINGKDIPIIL